MPIFLYFISCTNCLATLEKRYQGANKGEPQELKSEARHTAIKIIFYILENDRLKDD